MPRALWDCYYLGSWQVEACVERAGYLVNEFNLGLFLLEALSLAVLNPLFSFNKLASKYRLLSGLLIDLVDSLCYNFVLSLCITLSFSQMKL